MQTLRTPLTTSIAMPRLLTSIAWIMTLIASTLPIIVCREVLHYTPTWLHVVRITLLVVVLLAALTVPLLKPLRGFLFVLLALMIGWDILVPQATKWLYAHGNVVSGSFPRWAPGISLLLLQIVRLLPSLLILPVLLVKSMRREELFLKKGDLLAPVSLTRFLPRPLSWLQLGIVFLLIAGVVLPIHLYITVHPDIHKFVLVLFNVPFIVLSAVMNASNEEFEYRTVMMTRLLPAGGAMQALWISSVHFGLWHYYGNPSGPVGVLLAGTAGFFWGLGMLETRGMRWTWVTHFVQDVVIFSFLVMVL